MTDRRQQVQFRPGELAAELDKRSNPRINQNGVAVRDLERYYQAIDREVPRLEHMFYRDEMHLIAEALRGIETDLRLSPRKQIQIAVDDAIDEGKYIACGIDPEDLEDFTGNIDQLTEWQALCLLDAIERVWQPIGKKVDPIERLKSVGLVK